MNLAAWAGLYVYAVVYLCVAGVPVAEAAGFLGD